MSAGVVTFSSNIYEHSELIGILLKVRKLLVTLLFKRVSVSMMFIAQIRRKVAVCAFSPQLVCEKPYNKVFTIIGGLFDMTRSSRENQNNCYNSTLNNVGPHVIPNYLHLW